MADFWSIEYQKDNVRPLLLGGVLGSFYWGKNLPKNQRIIIQTTMVVIYFTTVYALGEEPSEPQI